MNFIKKNIKLILGIVIGAVLISGISVYATSTYYASQVTYKEGKTVEQALNELYNITNRVPQEVATLTTQGATYTFKNDGYITGTASTPDAYNAVLYFGETPIAVCPGDTSNVFQVSVYVRKDTVVSTRGDHGVYNLTCYEFSGE